MIDSLIKEIQLEPDQLFDMAKLARENVIISQEVARKQSENGLGNPLLAVDRSAIEAMSAASAVALLRLGYKPIELDSAVIDVGEEPLKPKCSRWKRPAAVLVPTTLRVLTTWFDMTDRVIMLPGYFWGPILPMRPPNGKLVDSLIDVAPHAEYFWLLETSYRLPFLNRKKRRQALKCFLIARAGGVMFLVDSTTRDVTGSDPEASQLDLAVRNAETEEALFAHGFTPMPIPDATPRCRNFTGLITIDGQRIPRDSEPPEVALVRWAVRPSRLVTWPAVYEGPVIRMPEIDPAVLATLTLARGLFPKGEIYMLCLTDWKARRVKKIRYLCGDIEKGYLWKLFDSDEDPTVRADKIEQVLRKLI